MSRDLERGGWQDGSPTDETLAQPQQQVASYLKRTRPVMNDTSSSPYSLHTADVKREILHKVNGSSL